MLAMFGSMEVAHNFVFDCITYVEEFICVPPFIKDWREHFFYTVPQSGQPVHYKSRGLASPGTNADASTAQPELSSKTRGLGSPGTIADPILARAESSNVITA
eukprot:3177413-Karenia_brevis.AAC.1